MGLSNGFIKYTRVENDWIEPKIRLQNLFALLPSCVCILSL